MFGFGKMMAGGGKAAQAFKSGDMGDKLGMIGAALGGDFEGLMQMIGQPGGQSQGGPLDQVSGDLIARLGEQSGLSPMGGQQMRQPVRRGFGFGFGRR